MKRPRYESDRESSSSSKSPNVSPSKLHSTLFQDPNKDNAALKASPEKNLLPGSKNASKEDQAFIALKAKIPDGKSFCSYYNGRHFEGDLAACATLEDKIVHCNAAIRIAKQRAANKAIVQEFEDQREVFKCYESLTSCTTREQKVALYKQTIKTLKDRNAYLEIIAELETHFAQFREEKEESPGAAVSSTTKKRKTITFDQVEDDDTFLEYLAEGYYDEEKQRIFSSSPYEDQVAFLGKVKSVAKKHASLFSENNFESYIKNFSYIGTDKLTPLAYVKRDLESLEDKKKLEEKIYNDSATPSSAEELTPPVCSLFSR